ncbi:hypothetical protein ACJJTC_017623 [Scirpophaga incertulas]
MRLYFIVIVIIVNLGKAEQVYGRIVKKGSYRTNLIKVRDCDKTTLPEPEAIPGKIETFYIEIYNASKTKSFLRGNLTLIYHHSGVSFQSVSYMWRDGKWKRYVALPHIDCKNPVIAFMAKILNISYDPEKCSFQKGVYTLPMLDMNRVEHMWTQEREYGRVLWKSEVMTKYNTLFCVMLETLVEPMY